MICTNFVPDSIWRVRDKEQWCEQNLKVVLKNELDRRMTGLLRQKSFYH